MNSIRNRFFEKFRNLLKKADQVVAHYLGDEKIVEKDLPIEWLVGKRLMEKKATIAMAESCTGGLMAHRMTNVAGSSDYFLFSGVTYSNESKIKLLGVLPSTIEKYGAVHEFTAKEMAEGAMRIGNATYGLSTTGIAGPSGGTKEKPVGTVCIGLATNTIVSGYRFYFPALSRLQNKEAFATVALELLFRELKKNGSPSC